MSWLSGLLGGVKRFMGVSAGPPPGPCDLDPCLYGSPADGRPMVLLPQGSTLTITDRLTYEHMTGQAKGEPPSQAVLDRFFRDADRACVVAGGLFRDAAIGGRVLADATDPEAISFLARATRIDEDPATFHHCACLGNLVIELYRGDQLLASLGVHHGKGLRWSGWKDDANLADPNRLITWMELHGLSVEVVTMSYSFEAMQVDLARKPAERLTMRVESYLSRGELDRALTHLEAAAELYPNEPCAEGLRGVVAAMTGDYVLALEHYDRSLELGYRSPGLHMHRAQALHSLGRLGDAFASATAAVELAPNATTYGTRARLAQLMGRDREAEEDFARAIDLDPANINLWSQRAEARMARREFGRAAEDYGQAIKLVSFSGGGDRPVDPDKRAAVLAMLLGQRSMARRLAGDVAGTTADLDAAVRVMPDRVEPYLNRASWYESRSVCDRAAADFERALQLEPGNPLARFGRARMAIVDEDFATALDDLDELLTLSPADPNFNQCRIRSLIGLGRLDEARWELEQLAAPSPEMPPSLVGVRAMLEKAAGNHSACREALEAAYRLAPANPFFCNGLAWFLATCPDPTQRDGRRAVTLARRALAASRVYRAAIHDTLAAALAESGDFEGAVHQERLALQALDPAATCLLRRYRSRLASYEAGLPYRADDNSEE